MNRLFLGLLLLGSSLSNTTYAQAEEEKENLMNRLYTVGEDEGQQDRSWVSRFHRSIDETFDESISEVKNNNYNKLYLAKDASQIFLGLKVIPKRAKRKISRLGGPLLAAYSAADIAYRMNLADEGKAVEPFPIAQHTLSHFGVPALVKVNPTFIQNDERVEYSDDLTPTRIRNDEELVIRFTQLQAGDKNYLDPQAEGFKRQNNKKYTLEISLDRIGSDSDTKIDEIDIDVDAYGRVSPEGVLISGGILNYKALQGKLELNSQFKTDDPNTLWIKLKLKERDSLFTHSLVSDTEAISTDDLIQQHPHGQTVLTFDASAKHSQNRVVAEMQVYLRRSNDNDREEVLETNESAIDDSPRPLKKEIEDSAEWSDYDPQSQAQ